MMALLILVTLALAIFPILQGYSMGEAAATALPYALIFGIIIVALPRIQQWQLARLYRQTPSLREQQTHEFSDSGFRMSNPLANTLVRWDAFQEVLETKEFFLLYISRSIAYFLPKRAVTGPQQLGELRELLKRELGRLDSKLRLLAA